MHRIFIWVSQVLPYCPQNLIGCCQVSEDRERELPMHGISHRGESLNPSVIEIQELIFF